MSAAMAAASACGAEMPTVGKPRTTFEAPLHGWTPHNNAFSYAPSPDGTRFLVHAFPERAHAWWTTHRAAGWASCPITENGVVRIMSHAAYSPKAQFTAGELIARLRTFVAHSDHEFWADDLSIRDETALAADRIHGGRQLTDLYLLALAVRHRGRLATFDTTIPLSTVLAAKPANMVVV